MKQSYVSLKIVMALLLSLALVGPCLARGGSFGGGGRSFGGGSFGGGRSFGGSFGGGSRSYGGSFGRSGTFGGSRGYGTQSRVSQFTTRTPVYSRSFAYGGQGGVAHYYGGWSDYSFGWAHPAWYMYTPFYPGFYYGPPVYAGGAYYPGSFDFLHLLIGILIFLFIIYMIVSIYKKVRA